MFNKTTIASIIEIAKQNNYEPAKLLAVADVESAGTAFWNIGGKVKPPVRFEGHYFYKRLNGETLDKAIKEGLASPKAGGVKNPNSFADRYKLIERAAAIDTKAAYESTSWGLGQVMGAHWEVLGFDSVEAFVEFNQTLTGQVESMVKFIDLNNARDEIESGNWAGFAKIYNGVGYKKNAYDVKLKKAYLKYKNSSDTIEEDEITQLQNMLNAIYPEYKLDTDGVFGPSTRAALRDFQLKNGLKSDGIYGPISREAIERKYLELSNNKITNAGVIGTAASTVAAGVTKAAETIEPFAKTSQIIQYVFIGLLVVSVLIMIKPYFWPKKVA